MVIDKQEDLSGLPETLIANAAQAAKDAGMEGKWVFTLQNPSVMPFLQYSDKRELREKMFNAYSTVVIIIMRTITRKWFVIWLPLVWRKRS